MDILISENKLNYVIQDYLEKNYGDLIYEVSDPDPWDKIKGTDYSKILEFKKNDYYKEIEFLYFENGWSETEDCKNCPMIHIVGGLSQELNELFGKLWEEPFKEWFQNKFNLKLDTIE